MGGWVHRFGTNFQKTGLTKRQINFTPLNVSDELYLSVQFRYFSSSILQFILGHEKGNTKDFDEMHIIHMYGKIKMHPHPIIHCLILCLTCPLQTYGKVGRGGGPLKNSGVFTINRILLPAGKFPEDFWNPASVTPIQKYKTTCI